MTGFTDRTLREIVHLGMGADHVRTRLTNIFGTDGVAVDGVRAGLRASGSWYLLDGLDVRAAPQARAVVALGDSLTGGTASTVDVNRRYTDNLARRIGGRNLSVLNQGASGNRLLTDASGSGVSVQVRFDRDVVAQTGVRTVILAEGIHDIGHDQGPVSGDPATAADLIAGLTNLVLRAHAHGLRIIGGTLTPVGGSKYDSAAAEAKRQAVNAWIRTSGAFDGVADFDAAVRDPLDPARFLPAYDSGDHLHPDDAGYQTMADVVDLRRL
jgi:lysophospholipase L1-like esterase